jgi:hypothetical protein
MIKMQYDVGMQIIAPAFFTDRIAHDHHHITWSLIRNFDLMDK